MQLPIQTEPVSHNSFWKCQLLVFLPLLQLGMGMPPVLAKCNDASYSDIPTTSFNVVQ